MTLTDFVATNLDVYVRKVEVNPTQGHGTRGIVSCENLAPCVIGVDGYGASDWMLDYQNDFGVFWDEENNCMIHFAPNNPSDDDWNAVFRGTWPNRDFGSGVYFAIGAEADVASKVHCGTVSSRFPNITWSSTSAWSRAFSAQLHSSSSVVIFTAAGSTKEQAIAALKSARRQGYNTLFSNRYLSFLLS